MGTSVRPLPARSASTLPIRHENLKPWPLHGLATITSVPAREEIDLKLFVGRDGVEADLGEVDRRVGQAGDVVAQEVADDRLVLVADGPIRRSSGSNSGPPCRATFTPRALKLGHAVKRILRRRLP